MAAEVNVHFDRISRSHLVPDLRCVVRTADELAEQIWRYAKPKCVSRKIEVSVDWDPVTGEGEGTIFAGFHVAGSFVVFGV